MPEFKVKLVNGRGRVSWRRIQAVSEEAMRESVKAQCLWLIGAPKQLNRGKTVFKLKLDGRILQGIIEQIVLMLEAGVGIQVALERLSEQYPQGKTRFFLTEVTARVAVDGDLSAAIGQFPNLFSPEMVAMMKPAQGAAKLIPLFERLAAQLEQQAAIRATIRKGTSYPLFVCSVGGIVIVLAMYFFVPRLQEMLAELVTSPPFMTRLLFGISYYFKTYLWLILASLVGLFYGVKALARVPKVQVITEHILLKTPRVKDAIAAIVLAQLLSNIGMLYGAGVPMEEALKYIIKGLRWTTYRKAVQETLTGLHNGDQMAESLRKTGCFPPMLCAMVGTGESVGKLTAIFDKLAKWYAKDAERVVAHALVLIEPVLIVIMSLFVGWILVSVYQPLSTLYQSIGRGPGG